MIETQLCKPRGTLDLCFIYDELNIFTNFTAGRSPVFFVYICCPHQGFFFFFCPHFYFPASGQAVDTGVVPSPPPGSCFIAHRVQQSHSSSIFHRVLLTHALALSASQFVHEKKSQRIYSNMHSAGLELTKLTYTRLEDNLIRHRGDRSKGDRSVTPVDVVRVNRTIFRNHSVKL